MNRGHSNRDVSRRIFLRQAMRASGAASLMNVCCLNAEGLKPVKPHPGPPALDIHVHLFGTGDGGSGCRFSKAMVNGLPFRTLRLKFGIPRRGQTLDASYEQVLADKLKMSGLAKAVVLAHDAVYDRMGKPDWRRTPIYVPNDYLLQVTGRHPDSMIPCISVNPDRADALDELERWAEKGVGMVKIHPPIQGVDISDRKHEKFFRSCAARNMIVMVHTGHEHSSPIIDVNLAHPGKLVPALDQGCRVVACHCGTGWPLDGIDMLPDFVSLLEKYPNLWGDTSVLGTPGRVRDVARLLATPDIGERLLHGSDFPVPCFPEFFKHLMDRDALARMQVLRNPFDQDLALKEAWGIGLASARRAYRFVCGQATK